MDRDSQRESGGTHAGPRRPTIVRIARYPLIGAPRDALAEGLRSIRVRPFRHLIFYRVQDSELILIRLLHGAIALERQDYRI
jgi:plasmid stabilization system protein ParE